jgi:hypothetical protein
VLQQLTDIKPLTWASTHFMQLQDPGLVLPILTGIVGGSFVWLLIRMTLDWIVVGRAVKYVSWFDEVLEIAILARNATAIRSDN